MDNIDKKAILELLKFGESNADKIVKARQIIINTQREIYILEEKQDEIIRKIRFIIGV